MASPVFPSELFDAIIDHAHVDKTALLSFSLVCRDWMRSSRYHLFSTIHLNKDNARAFPALLHSPVSTISPVVKNMEMRDGQFDGAWLDDVIPLLPAPLHSVQSLSIYSSQSTLVPETRQALAANFCNTLALHLFEMELDDSSDVFAAICAFPLLESVTLDGGWCKGGAEKAPAALLSSQHLRSTSPISPCLQTLDLLCSTEDLLQGFLSIDPTPRIQTLRLHYLSQPEIPAITRYLEALGTSLRHLTLGFRDFCWDGMDLSHNTGLVSLRVVYPHHQLGLDRTMVPASEIIRSVESCDLEHLTFAFRSEPRESTVQMLCDGMAAALRGARFATKLKEVNFWFGGPVKAEMRECITNELKGILGGVRLSMHERALQF